MTNPSGTDKKARLRAWKEQQRVEARAKFPLADSVLAEFFAGLDEWFSNAGCVHDTRGTEAVASELGLLENELVRLLAWCRENGGYCDCEISGNTRDAWEQARDRT